MYCHEHRLIEHVVGPQQFDATTRRRLTRTIGRKMPALEASLNIRLWTFGSHQ